MLQLARHLEALGYRRAFLFDFRFDFNGGPIMFGTSALVDRDCFDAERTGAPAECHAQPCILSPDLGNDRALQAQRISDRKAKEPRSMKRRGRRRLDDGSQILGGD